MIFFELGAIVAFVAFVVMGFNQEREDAIICFIFAVLIFVLSLGGIWPRESGLQVYNPIVSLERGQEINGSFVLGFGHIETGLVYYAYEWVGDDTYKLIKLDNVSITETNSKNPARVRSRECKRNLIFVKCKDTVDTIYVPKGTIKKEFRG